MNIYVYFKQTQTQNSNPKLKLIIVEGGLSLSLTAFDWQVWDLGLISSSH